MVNGGDNDHSVKPGLVPTPQLHRYPDLRI
jgi:hypothetical protein